TYTPAAGFSGDDDFTYTISDVDGEVSTATVTVTVNATVVTIPDPDPIEPDPDPVDPDPDPDTTDPTDTAEETPTEDPEPVVVIDPDDEVAEPAIVEDVSEDTSETAAKTLDKDPRDPDDDTDAPATAADSGSVLQDPGFMTSINSDANVPSDLAAPLASENISASIHESALLKKIDIDSSETTTLLLKRYLDQINFLSEVDYSNAIEQLRDALDEFKQEAESEDQYYQTVIGSAIAVSTGLSVGYVVWLIRGGMLLSSVLFSMPAWHLADPLPLLAGGRDDDEEDGETLETIIRDSVGKNSDNKTTKEKTGTS
ncbi:MAG: hypothetical protein KJO32_03010, partial [Deltaproteobacteria bacterium]|nr:hypothetical protein [Deltaproteobacteria bacterium]